MQFQQKYCYHHDHSKIAICIKINFYLIFIKHYSGGDISVNFFHRCVSHVLVKVFEYHYISVTIHAIAIYLHTAS